MKILTQEDIQRIHAASLDILQSTGVTFHDNPEAIELLESHGCQADGFRMRFPGELVEEAMARVPDRNTLKFCVFDVPDEVGMKQGESHVGVIGNAYYIYDYEKGAHRDCVEADIDDKLLIIDSLLNIEFDVCGLILHSERHGGRVFDDYDKVEAGTGFIRRRVMDRSRMAGLTGKDLGTLSLRYGGRSTEESRLELLGTMILRGVASTEDLLEKRDSAFVWCNPVSPLQFHPEEAEGIIRVARSDKRNRWVMISPEVMLGTTGPVTVAGAVVQANAELLAGTVLAQLAQAGTPVIYGCVGAPADLRSAEINHGNFETGLLNVATVQMADHYGMPSRISPPNTSDHKPGVRAAVEQVMGLHMGIGAGGNLITTGLLDSTLMVSYEHLVLVDELIGQIRSVTRGIDTTDEIGMAVDEIKEHGHPSPGFLASDHTLKNMKRDVYYSDYTGRTDRSYEEWYDKAHTRVKQVLDRKPVGGKADATIEGRLAAVEARLREDNESWRKSLDGGIRWNRAVWRESDEEWWRFYVQDL